MEDRLERSFTLLREIYDWYINNLKDVTPIERTTVAGTESTIDAILPVSDINFELYVESDQSSQLVCRHVGLNYDWNTENSNRTVPSEQSPLYICCCSEQDTAGSQSHRATVNAYRCNPSTILPPFSQR